MILKNSNTEVTIRRKKCFLKEKVLFNVKIKVSEHKTKKRKKQNFQTLCNFKIYFNKYYLSLIPNENVNTHVIVKHAVPNVIIVKYLKCVQNDFITIKPYFQFVI